DRRVANPSWLSRVRGVLSPLSFLLTSLFAIPHKINIAQGQCRQQLTICFASRFCPLTSLYSKIYTHFPATLLIPKDQRGRGGALIMASLSNIPRCQHIKVNGTQCGSPALKRNRFCYFHNEWREAATRRAKSKAGAKPESLIRQFPVLEDANSIQVGLMHVMRLLVSGEMDSKTAGLLLYALQTASFNLRHTNF